MKSALLSFFCFVFLVFRLVIPAAGQCQVSVGTISDCLNNGAGSATATASNGQPPWEFFWSTGYYEANNTGISTISGLSAGNYDITVADYNGCFVISEFVIQGAPPSNNDCPGAITLPMGSGSCTGGQYATACATVSAPAQPCFGGLNDIWFQTSSTQPGFNFSTDALPAGSYCWLELYSGTCAALVYQLCIEEFQPNSTYYIPAPAGNYKLRVLFFNENEGLLHLCVWESGSTPVELVSFEGRVVSDRVLLRFSTASESNNAYFEVEHSPDGVAFKTIGTVPGHGTTSEPNSYEFVHENAPSGLHYYRLKQVDLDGTASYSKLISLEVAQNEFAVYPNPTTGKVYFAGKIPDECFVEISDGQGRTVAALAMLGPSLDLSGFSPGFYILHLHTDHRRTALPLVIMPQP